ncbi:MAG TPA: RES domain-containing protein [Bryobacteraceae bacterium]|nr:RES domain-containing protein [Bryobacteraceae bacterium]
MFPFLAAAGKREPGGALYVPPQGGGRIDNPGIYSVLYLSDAAAGAIAEAFGRFPEWTPAILEGSPSLPGSIPAIARYRLAEDAPICNLDDPKQLLALGLRPSDIVGRDYTRSRAWARRIYAQNRWSGVRWWSYYDPAWSSFGLWEVKGLTLDEVTPLRLDNPALFAASRTIVRGVVARRS